MKKAIIDWKENGWTVVQEANAAKHIVEISCLAENGSVVEIRKRHNDGEEEVLKKAINAEYSLPMSLDDFKAVFESGKIDW